MRYRSSRITSIWLFRNSVDLKVLKELLLGRQCDSRPIFLISDWGTDDFHSSSLPLTLHQIGDYDERTSGRMLVCRALFSST